MEFGLYLVTQYDSNRSLAGIGDELVEQVRLARRAGFRSVNVGEHHVTPSDQYLLNEAVIAHLAEHTRDMTLSATIVLLPFHNPVRVAEYGATVDILTGGHFRLGVGMGYRQVEFDAFGVDRSDALGRLRESVEIIERLWTEDEVTYEGNHFELDGVSINPKPMRKPRPPIITGASNESSIRRAARLTDGFIAAHVPFDLAERHVSAFRDERSKRGLDPGYVGLLREGFVAPSTEAAEEAVREPLLEKYASYSDWGQDDVIEDDTFDSPWDRLKSQRFLVGTPEDVIDEIDEYRSAIDPDEIVVRMQFPNSEFDAVHDSIELFGDEIIPAFQS